MNRYDLFEKGYIIIPGTVPQSLCEAVIADIETHTKGGTEGVDGQGMVEMYHYQSMWDVRQHPAVHQLFAELVETEKLWVSIDRCNRKQPDPTGLEVTYPHWDTEVNRDPRPFQVQGLIALANADETMGGFFCVPDLYQELDEYKRRQPTGKIRSSCLFRTSYWAYDMGYSITAADGSPPMPVGRWPIVQIPLKRGDLLIWDSYMPHGNGVNRGERVRYAQYVTMFPEGDMLTAKDRVRCWAGSFAPSGWAFPGDPRGLERNKKMAVLSELGVRLLGGQKWRGTDL